MNHQVITHVKLMYIHVYTTDTVTGLYVIAHLVGCMSKYLAVLNSWWLMSLFFASEIPISLGKIHRILGFSPRVVHPHPSRLAARPGRSYKTTPKVMGPHWSAPMWSLAAWGVVQWCTMGRRKRPSIHEYPDFLPCFFQSWGLFISITMGFYPP